MKSLNKYILSQAIKAGICNEWAQKIALAESTEELLEMYVKGIDFCLQHDFPSPADLVRLGGGKLPQHGIYVDTETLNLHNAEFAVLLGQSSGVIRIDGFTVSQLFVKHQSSPTIEVKDSSFAVIDVFDNGIIKLFARGTSKVLVNLYGNGKLIQQPSNKAYIKVIHKNKVTY